MVLTSEKIEVTQEMMVQNNMYRNGDYGIPIDPKNPSLGLSWKSLFNIEIVDFDKLEEYFLLKQEQLNSNK